MKRINNLTIDELKKVFTNNQKLQNEVYNDAIDIADLYVRDYMNCFEAGAIDYNIGYPGDYITVKDARKFNNGLRDVYKSFCVLPDESLKVINYCDDLLNRYEEIYMIDWKNANRLEKKISELTTDLKNVFLKRVLNEYNYYYNGDNLQEYFIENYIEIMNDNYYVDDNYILYQHIEYEKSYK